MKHYLVFILCAALTFATSEKAFSAGFALKEQSAAALGNAFAGATSAAEDVSYMFFNPAALGNLEKHQIAVVGSYIAPFSELQKGSASTVSGTPIGVSDGESDAAKNVVLPALYGSWALSEHWRFGLGVNVPYGLETNYDENWIGRYHAVDSKLMTTNINPVLAWKANDKVTLAFGFQAQYADAELSNAVDFGTIAALQGAPVTGGTPATDGFAELEGDDWGFGYNLGLLIEPRQGTRIGLAYRSKIHHKLKGDIDFTLDSAGIGANLRQNFGLFQDGNVSADLTTPETASAGIYHEITPQWAVMADLVWTRWSQFDELRIQFRNPVQEDSVTVENWDDSWFYSLGLTWKPSKAYALRIGAAYDETPIPDSARTPRIPGDDRTWLALGGHWQITPALGLDAGYTHIWVDDSNLNLVATPTNDTTRGNLSGEYENDIDIITLAATYSF